MRIGAIVLAAGLAPLLVHQLREPRAVYRNDKFGISIVPPTFPPLAESEVSRRVAHFWARTDELAVNDAATSQEVLVCRDPKAAAAVIEEFRNADGIGAWEQREVNSGDFKGVEYSGSGSRDGRSTTTLMRSLLGPRLNYVVRCRARAADFPALEGEFKSSLATFGAASVHDEHVEALIYRDSDWGFSLGPLQLGRADEKPKSWTLARFMGPLQPSAPTAVEVDVAVEARLLEDYKKTGSETLESLKAMDLVSDVVTRDTTHGSRPACVYEYRWRGSGECPWYRYLVLVVGRDVDLVSVQAVALETEFAKYETVLRSSVDSLEVK